jgi:hypothetical protein
MFRISRPVEECVHFYIGRLAARWEVRLVANKGPARRGIAAEEAGVSVRALIELSHPCVLHDLLNAEEWDASQEAQIPTKLGPHPARGP